MRAVAIDQLRTNSTQSIALPRRTVLFTWTLASVIGWDAAQASDRPPNPAPKPDLFSQDKQDLAQTVVVPVPAPPEVLVLPPRSTPTQQTVPTIRANPTVEIVPRGMARPTPVESIEQCPQASCPTTPFPPGSIAPSVPPDPDPVIDLATPIVSPLPSPPVASPPVASPPVASPATPLLRSPILTTADQLRQGEFQVNLRYRQSFPAGSAGEVGLTGQPTLGFVVGITNGLELAVDAQSVDNSGPGRQGEFQVQRINVGGGGPNIFQEFAFQAKQRLWQNAAGTQALSLAAGVSTVFTERPFAFRSPTGRRDGGENEGIVPSLELPFTFKPSDRWQVTLSPKVAFFPSDHALYFSNLSGAVPGSFGTTFGLAGGVSYRVSPRLLLWGDAFFPFTGNNTIDRDSGRPAKTATFNAGVRYLLNPRLALDVFASNALGNTGALSIVGDRNFPALGLGVSYLPGITAANRAYPTAFRPQAAAAVSSGFAHLLAATLPANQLALTVQGGGQGLLSSLRYGLMDDLEVGVFVDQISGKVDESELGISGKLRFLHQPSGDPVTLTAVATVARSNNVLINLVDDNRNALGDRGLKKGGFRIANEQTGELLIVTLSTPIQYQFRGGTTVWATPTLGFVQRSGLEVAGVTLGGSVPVSPTLRAIAELGIDFAGRGNAFIGNSRDTVLPWIAGIRWQPRSFLNLTGVEFDLYATNRVGASPFHTLRVRADNDFTVGAGVTIPVKF
jgi:hypothetical protein